MDVNTTGREAIPRAELERAIAWPLPVVAHSLVGTQLLQIRYVFGIDRPDVQNIDPLKITDWPTYVFLARLSVGKTF